MPGKVQNPEGQHKLRGSDLTINFTKIYVSPDRQAIDLRFLLPDQIVMIDEALTKVGEYGEVRLVLEKGTLRFVVVQQSFDARHWQSG
jgi:hypothetical protein